MERLCKDLLNIEQIGEVRMSLQRYKKMAEIPWGPKPQAVASDSRAERTSSEAMDNEDGRNENWIYGTNHGLS